MRSNVTVGPPVDLLAYAADELDVVRHRRFVGDDPDLLKIRTRWEQGLRQAVNRLPDVSFKRRVSAGKALTAEETIQIVEKKSRNAS